MNSASSRVTLGSPDNQYDYPLVTVEIMSSGRWLIDNNINLSL